LAEVQARLSKMVDEYLEVNTRRGELAVVVWILAYAAAARTSGIDAQVGTVLSKLLAAGYLAEDRALQPASNKTSYGRRMIGAFMESIARGDLPPQPTLQEWLRTLQSLPNA
jgi:hypothetical protein